MLADSPCLGFCVLVACRQLYKSDCWLVSLLIRHFCSFHGGKQGSCPDRGQRMGGFPFICPSVHLSIYPSPLWAIWLASCLAGCLGLRPGWLGLRPGWMAQRGEGRTDESTYRKSPHSTGLCPLSGPLPKKASLYEERRRAKAKPKLIPYYEKRMIGTFLRKTAA